MLAFAVDVASATDRLDRGGFDRLVECSEQRVVLARMVGLPGFPRFTTFPGQPTSTESSSAIRVSGFEEQQMDDRRFRWITVDKPASMGKLVKQQGSLRFRGDLRRPLPGRFKFGRKFEPRQHATVEAR